MQPDTYRLGIDTTNQNLCIALTQGQAVLNYENLYPFLNAAEALAPKIADMLSIHQVTPSQIDNIISVTGPGGFSGVRIGTSFVTGFAFGHDNMRICGITSLEAIALSISTPKEDSIIIACLNARRNGVYIAIFNHLYHRLTADAVINIQDLPAYLSEFQDTPYYLGGHGYTFVQPYLKAELNLAEPILSSLAQEFTRKAVSFSTHSPIYLREADAKLSQKPSFKHKLTLKNDNNNS